MTSLLQSSGTAGLLHGIAAQYLPICLSIVTQQQNILLLYISLSFLSLSVLVTDCLCHKPWLDVHYKKSKPFKIIFKVLNYARKTKYPERRSAFTYIDEEEPSRLDYGKHKFGDHLQKRKWRMLRQS